jgi:hypothetical protein
MTGTHRQIAWWLAASILFFHMVFYNGGYVMTTNVHLLMTRSIVEDRDIDIRNNCAAPLHEYQSAVRQYRGNAYSKFPPGRGLIALGLYAPLYAGAQLFDLMAGQGFDANDIPWDWVIKNVATITNILATALAAALVYLSVVYAKRSTTAGLFAGLVYGLASAMFSFTRSVQVEPVAALCVAGAVWCMLHPRHDTRSGYHVGAYALLGLGCTISPQLVVVYGAFILFDIVETRWARLLQALGVGAVVTSVFLVHNYVRFQRLLDFGYSAGEERHGIVALGAAAGAVLLCMGLRRTMDRRRMWTLCAAAAVLVFCAAVVYRPWMAYGYFISPTHGIFVYSPALLLVGPGLWYFRQHDRMRALQLGIVMLLYCAFCVYHGMDKSFILTRYAAPVFPVFALAAGLSLDRIVRVRIPWMLAGLGFIMQMLISVNNIYNATFWTHAGSATGIPPVPHRFGVQYTLLWYKFTQLWRYLAEVPAFFVHPSRFEGSYFFNHYWFVVYRQELPDVLILAVLAALVPACIMSTVLLVRTSRVLRTVR